MDTSSTLHPQRTSRPPINFRREVVLRWSVSLADQAPYARSLPLTFPLFRCLPKVHVLSHLLLYSVLTVSCASLIVLSYVRSLFGHSLATYFAFFVPEPPWQSLFQDAIYMPGLAFSASTALQYLVLGVLGYILAGAPSLPLRSGRDATFQRWSRRASPGVASVSHEKLETLVIPDRNLSCEGHGFKGVYILNREPLVAYIEGFLSDEEVQHVIRIR